MNFCSVRKGIEVAGGLRCRDALTNNKKNPFISRRSKTKTGASSRIQSMNKKQGHKTNQIQSEPTRTEQKTRT